METEHIEWKCAARWAKHLDEKRYPRSNVEQGLQNAALTEYEEQGQIAAATDECHIQRGADRSGLARTRRRKSLEVNKPNNKHDLYKYGYALIVQLDL